MRFSTIFATAAFLLPLASAKCYKEGPGSPNKQLAVDNLDAVCRGMQGNFVAGLERTSCVSDVANGNEWFFSVKRIGKTDFTLLLDQCKFGLGREIGGCSTGGDRKDGNWEYRSDANQGVCLDVKYINDHPPKYRKREITSVFGESEASAKKGKRDVKITFGNPVPPQPAQKRGLRFAV
ncbi:MAG: hypothetical protein M1830_010252 [Pleopsidium flavum]|nr:MAG: hypothetical protein M1830_010252 [Pleopsidium flavum]